MTVDLAAVTFMDSTGLNTLVDANARAARGGWSFAVIRPSPAVVRVLEMAGVQRLLGE